MMRPPRSGKAEGLSFSLSRWTDVPHAKWDWFRAQLARKYMLAFDQRTAVPSWWSLTPEDTLGLVFWTKDPTNLLKSLDLLAPFPFHVHLTLTGWTEVEKGAPDLDAGCDLMRRAVDAFGPERISWRFSPIPSVPDVLDRFRKICSVAAPLGLRTPYVAFLQPNDLLPECRTKTERLNTLSGMGQIAQEFQAHVLLCADDKALFEGVSETPGVSLGVCVPNSFPNALIPPVVEDCGCVMMADPFTITESCTMGCAYCYAADKSLSPKKHNTTRHYLPTL